MKLVEEDKSFDNEFLYLGKKPTATLYIDDFNVAFGIRLQIRKWSSSWRPNYLIKVINLESILDDKGVERGSDTIQNITILLDFNNKIQNELVNHWGDYVDNKLWIGHESEYNSSILQYDNFSIEESQII